MTNTANPLLTDAELPAFSAISPDHVNPAIDEVLAGFRAEVERLAADPQARDFASLMAPLERWEETLGRTFSPVSHLHGVKDSPELREAYSAALEKLTEHSTELGQHRGLVLVAEERAYTSADEFEEAVDFIASLAAVASSSGLDVEVVTTAGERASHGGGRSTAVLDLLALVERGASGVDTRLLRANRATTIVVRGQGVLGWWDRIPAVSVMRP